MPAKKQKLLDKMMKENTLGMPLKNGEEDFLHPPVAPPKDDFLLRILENNKESCVLGEHKEQDDVNLLNKLRKKYQNLTKLFPEYRFAVLHESWDVAILEETISSNKAIILGNNNTNHGEIHGTILQQSTNFVENAGSKFVNLDGLSRNVLGNQAITNSSKIIIGELLDTYLVNSSTNVNKVLIWNILLELCKTIFYNKIKERMTNKIDQMEERFAKNIQEVEKED